MIFIHAIRATLFEITYIIFEDYIYRYLIDELEERRLLSRLIGLIKLIYN